MTDWVGRAYDRYADTLYRYAVMILADCDEAADAVHRVFVGLLGRRRADVEQLAHYLRRATRNECYSRLRRRAREGRVDATFLEPIASPDDPDLRIAVERALRALPAEQREVVHLKVFEGLTFQEIANLTGESINTIASRYRYAIDKLRVTL
jgi:RNA polymerase sigma-70 factor, ECF subfamily